jgi:hypothetical protein
LRRVDRAKVECLPSATAPRHAMRHRYRPRLFAFAGLVAVAAVVLPACSPKNGQRPSGTWTPISHTTVLKLTSSQGVATRSDDSLLFRGSAVIPAKIRREGFNHIGDPEIADGDIFDAYQGKKWNSPKMFLVTLPNGKRIEYRHPLDRGELFNNSFAAVSPDKQWMISGEFGLQKRLQVFPAPLLNHSTPSNGGELPQAGQIELSRPVKNIQGCDFFSPERIICTSDDVAKEVFRVDLPHALDGKPITGNVANIMELPKLSKCTGRYEIEGVDYDIKTKILRAEMVSPGVCSATATVFAFRWKPTG